MLLDIFTLLGSIALFLYGLNLYSSGLQKSMGDKVKNFIPLMKSNKLNQILTGCGLSAAMQSSSSTTVMVVSLVNIGLITLNQAVGVIFGANIGTTITAWLVTVCGFSLNASYFGFPLLAFGFFFMFSKKSRFKRLSEIILGISILFIGLMYMQDAVKHLTDNSKIAEILSCISNYGIGSVVIYLFIGIIISFILQSSSATVVLTLVLLFYGLITFKFAALIVLGANIGTTITANIVAIKGNYQARQAALIHLVFNTLGVIIVLLLFKPFILLCDWLIGLFGQASIIGKLYGICAIHTLFNLINAFILIWFSQYIVKFVNFIFKDKLESTDKRIKYIGLTPLNTPAVAIDQAYKEVINFSEICYESFDYIKLAINTNDPDIFEDCRCKLIDYERLTDKFEYKIAAFLNKISTNSISTQESDYIKILYRIIGELESLGDSGENISRILERERLHNTYFNQEDISKINLLVENVNSAYVIMLDNLKQAYDNNLYSIENAYIAEDKINVTRDKLRDEGVTHIDVETKGYQSLSYYLDILAELESMGDFMINISQAAVKINNKEFTK